MFKKEAVLKLQKDVGEALTKELMLVFIDETTKLVENLLAAHKQAQIDKIILFSHSLKSSARTYGAETLACLCEEIEVKGKSNNKSELNMLLEQLPDVSEKTLLLAIKYT